MKSTILIAKDYGSSEVLSFLDTELAPLESGFVRVKVKTAGINPIDARRMTGEFKHASLPQTFGTEYAGVIAEVHPSVTDWKVGDEVLGSGGAFTHATVIDVPASNLVQKPQALDWNIAGSIAGVAQTAMTIFDEIGDIKSLLIHGASGGVGSIAIQLARLKGIEVVATASEKNQDYLKSLGAIAVPYGTGLIKRLQDVYPNQFDASIDMAGTEEATQTSLECVKPNGFIGSIAGRKLSSARVQPVWVKRNIHNLKYVVDGVAEGKLKWDVSAEYPFEHAAQAYSDILDGHTRGKSILTF